MSNLAGGRLFTRSELNKLDFFGSFWGNAKKNNFFKRAKISKSTTLILIEQKLNLITTHNSPTQ